MDPTLFIGTSTGISTCKREGKAWSLQHQAASEKEITSLSTSQGAVLAGTRDGILRSEDLGRKWVDSSQGLGIRYVRWLASHPQEAGLVYAGTEPAGIYISRDSGESWMACPDVFELRERGGWSLPYSPAAGCVRGFAFHGQRQYAAAEVGGVLRSTDGGRRWEMTNGTTGGWQGRVNTDVHSIEVHPNSPELVYAPTGDGFYRSWDGGESWEQRYACYCRAAWVDPDNPEHMILGPADSVDRGGRIEESRDGGLSWQPASAGLETPWPRHMVERFYQIGDELLAVLSNGELLASPLDRLSWEKIQAGSGEVRAVAWIVE